MAEDVLTYNDIIQQYHNNIVNWEGSLVYISGVSEEKPHKVNMVRLLDGKKFIREFSLKTFSPPNARIGNVNVGGSVVYVTRKPVRKMNVGLSKSNLQAELLPVHYPEGSRETQSAVLSLKSADLARTMAGDFPSFEECLTYVKSFKGAMAFDRQFCIDHTRSVFYKTMMVGDLPKNCSKVERIVFNKQYESLALMIGDNCAKTLQAVGA